MNILDPNFYHMLFLNFFASAPFWLDICCLAKYAFKINQIFGNWSTLIYS